MNLLFKLLILPSFLMAQNTNNGDDYLKQLFLDMEFRGVPAPVILKTFRHDKRFTEQPSFYTESLGNVFLGNSRQTKLTNYYFKFTTSPISNLTLDFGVIKVAVHESTDSMIFDHVDWSVHFRDSAKANQFFESLFETFLPISSEHLRQKEDVGEYMSFILLKPSALGYKHITFALTKPLGSDYYEISFLPVADMSGR